MPWFRECSIADVTRRDVQRWFASLHATPAAADRSLPILSVILREAEIYGYRPEDSNPCTGVRRYRRRGRERFLTLDETRDRLPRSGRWIFPASKGAGPMSTETLYRCWRPLRAAAGVPDVRLHDLRHSYASFALRQGETILTIGRLLGHRDPATTLK